MTDNPANRVITPEAILSYPWLHEAQPISDDEKAKGKKPKYSATLVFKAGTNMDALKAAAISVADAKWGPGKWKEMLAESKKSTENGGPVKFRMPFRGDAKPGYPEGSTFINCRADNQPGLVYAHSEDGGKRPAKVPQDKIKETFYAGSRVRASVNAFAYDNNGNRGVSFGLNNVQKIGEGERLDSRVAADDEFVADLSAAPADLDGLIG